MIPLARKIALEHSDAPGQSQIDGKGDKLMNKPGWFLIESEHDYDKVTARYEEVKHAPKGSDEHKEKMALVRLISIYEKEQWTLPDVDPTELIKLKNTGF